MSLHERLSGNEKFINELRALTNLSIDEILEKLKPLKASDYCIKKYYSTTGKFPCEIVDTFLAKKGFKIWYNLFRGGLS